MEQEKQRGARRWLTLLGAYKYVLIVVAAGILCLVWPGGGQAEEPDRTESVSLDLEAVQAEMEEILSAIEGAGELRLMLTVDAGPRRQLAGDTSLSYSGAVEAPEDYQRTNQPLVLSGGGAEEVVVTEEVYPTFRGALVVCQGAGDPAVKLTVTEAVSALTGLGSDRICVVQGQEQR